LRALSTDAVAQYARVRGRWSNSRAQATRLDLWKNRARRRQLGAELRGGCRRRPVALLQARREAEVLKPTCAERCGRTPACLEAVLGLARGRCAMSARSICDEVSGVGAELASGDERARALRRAAACRRCRRKLAELADVADELLFMALPTSRRGLRVTAARAPRRVGLARPPVYAPVPGWLARRARYRPPRPGRVTTGERGRAQAPRGASTQRLPRGASCKYQPRCSTGAP
jgi:hypothetical protein